MTARRNLGYTGKHRLGTADTPVALLLARLAGHRIGLIVSHQARALEVK